MPSTRMCAIALGAVLLVLCSGGVASAHKLGVVVQPDWRGGLRVQYVLPGSRADFIGLQPGDRIVNICHYSIRTFGDIPNALHQAAWMGIPLRVVVVRYNVVMVLQEFSGGGGMVEYRLPRR